MIRYVTLALGLAACATAPQAQVPSETPMKTVSDEPGIPISVYQNPILRENLGLALADLVSNGAIPDRTTYCFQREYTTPPSESGFSLTFDQKDFVVESAAMRAADVQLRSSGGLGVNSMRSFAFGNVNTHPKIGVYIGHNQDNKAFYIADYDLVEGYGGQGANAVYCAHVKNLSLEVVPMRLEEVMNIKN